LLARRLVTEGFADPQPAATGQPEPDEITIAIPVRDRAVELARLLDGLARTVPTGVAVLVLDDGSRDDTAAVAAAAGATVLRHAISQGPAAARNALLAATATPFVLFLDSDCCPTPGWLEPLLAHLADPVVAAVAPRVRSLPGSGLLARYERSQSPLDLGGRPGLVRPGGRVSYVPAAALLVRRAAGIYFETALRFGEDVDLVWRLTEAGWSIRYEPASIVEHAPRADWRGWLAQRHGYGSSAGPLALRHRGTLRPLAGGGAGAATAALLLFGRPRLALATSAISVGVLSRRLPASCGPVHSRAALAVRLAVRNQPAASLALAETVRRSWLPIVGALVTVPAGRRILLAATLPVAVEWWLRRPPVAWPTWTAMRLLDDAAYCSGVWIGCARARTAAPLLPRL
jgi:mycofactocin system glycosyltransferase